MDAFATVMLGALARSGHHSALRAFATVLLGAFAIGACGGGETKSAPERAIVSARPDVTTSVIDAGSDAGSLENKPKPACEESATNGAWERAVDGERGIARTIGTTDGKTFGAIAQAIEGRGDVRLRFLGTHVFDLLDKIDAEGGASEAEKRRVICAVLDEVAKSGAPVVRIWGTLKRTGNAEEIERARSMLALVLDEDARRKRPLRFVVSLLNHQPGYGLPDPEVSLDDQKTPGWSAKEVYLEGAWRKKGVGQLAERVERYRSDEGIRSSPYVLAWEMVNELDTHRSVSGGALSGPDAEKLVKGFLVPVATRMAEAFPQPIVLGDLRGGLTNYRAFSEGLVGSLPDLVRKRLVWTSHVYVETANPAPGAAERKALLEAATRKVDVDIEVARKAGLPFLLGEIGQLVRGAKTAYCADGPVHDLPGLLEGVLSPSPDPHGRGQIDAALFWGEGLCGLAVGGSPPRRLSIGAGGDSADLGPSESAAREALRKARASPRFLDRPRP